MDNEIRIVPKNLRKTLKKQTYINLNHIQISSKKKLAELGKMLRDSTCEFFRIIYMRNDIIVGENIISVIYPIYRHYFYINLNAKIKAERCIYKLANQMKILKANSYYIVHNSSIRNNSTLKQDIDTTRFFEKNLRGFKGHLIINYDSYYWIDIKDNNVRISNKKQIRKRLKNKIFRYCTNNNTIKKRKDIVKIVHNIQNSKDYSIIIITNLENILQIIIDMPNHLFYSRTHNIEKYLKKFDAKDFKVFLVTKDKEVFNRSKILVPNKVLYQEINGNLYMDYIN